MSSQKKIILQRGLFVISAIFGLSYATFPSFAQNNSTQVNESQTSTNSKTNNDMSVIVVSQKLKPLLEEFARLNKVSLNISNKIKNVFVRSKRYPSKPEQFLKEISNDYSMDWYQRGDEFFLSSKDERTSRMINLKKINYNKVQTELAHLIKNTQDFTFDEITSSNSVFVSGPPTYIALVELVIEGMINNASSSADNVAVVRFGVKYPSANSVNNK